MEFPRPSSNSFFLKLDSAAPHHPFAKKTYLAVQLDPHHTDVCVWPCMSGFGIINWLQGRSSQRNVSQPYLFVGSDDHQEHNVSNTLTAWIVVGPSPKRTESLTSFCPPCCFFSGKNYPRHSIVISRSWVP